MQNRRTRRALSESECGTPRESLMNSTRFLVGAAVGLTITGHVAFAQDLSRYRGYALEASLESVITSSGARVADAKTIHERPARIQELEWRAPYVISGRASPDPVREIAFTFYNDALYQVMVTYDRDRTDGLTNTDMIESISATYGAPVAKSVGNVSRRAAPLPRETIVVALWENAASSLTLLRGEYTPEFQLMLVSKPLSLQAQSAIREAVRLDAVEAPRRELEQRKKEAAAASDARDKARTTNKEAFRP
jgi:hypothetical protein